MIRIYSFLLLAAFSINATATILSPSSDDVIASWNVSVSSSLTIDEASDRLSRAALFNQPSSLTDEVSEFINSSDMRNDMSERARLLKARWLQRNHHFEQARELLLPLNQPSSKLLLANVYNNLGKFDESVEVCKTLMGKVSHIITMTCQLDAYFQASPTIKTYQQLVRISELGRPGSLQTSQWIASTLAAMALYLDMPDQALNHLSGLAWQDMSSGTVALWAKSQLATGNPRKVLISLSNRITRPDDVDDSVLFELARAEKMLDEEAQWSARLKDRIRMREWREDGAHAAYVAQYYLDISADQDKAAHFAALNWKNAKGLEDRMLLNKVGGGADDE